MKHLTFFALLSLTSATWAAELALTNPDFEQGSSGWTIGDPMGLIDASAAKDGGLGLLVDDRDSKSGSNVRSERIQIEAGTSYQLDFDAKLISGSGIAVYMQFYDANGTRLGNRKERTEILRTLSQSSSNWTSYSLAATAPASAKTVTIWIHSFNGNQVKATFDNFKLKTVSDAAVKAHPSTQAATSSPYSWVGDPDALPTFEKKKPSAAFAELKVLQADGSAYRTPQEDWVNARRLIREDPEWRAWFEQKKAEIDAWITHNRDRANWEAGWNHEFISPKDNSFLVWTEDVPGEDIDHFTSKAGDHVEITPTLFRAWVGAFRKNHASMLIEAGYLYHLTEESRYAEWVASQLDFYANNYTSWGNGVAQKKHSHLGYQSLDDAVIISRQIDAARLVFDFATPDRRQAWFEKLFKPEAEILHSCYQTIHNIATWQRATQAKIALLYNDSELWEQAVETKYGLKAQFLRGVTSDYFWYEQSMGYNAFIIMASDSLFTFTGLLDRKDLLKEEAEIAQNMILAPLAVRFPNKQLPNPADNTGTPRASTRWLTRIYRILPTYIGLNNALGTKSWDSLLDPPASILPANAPSSPSLPAVVSMNMESSRFALLKEDPWQVFFHFGQLNRSHAQAEALNWSASYGNTMITQDVGTVGYGSAMSNGYYRKGIAQNIPLVSGEGQRPWNRGKLLNYDAEKATVSAEQPEYRENVSAKRTLAIDGKTLIDTTSIQINGESATAEPLGLTLHLEGQPELGESFNPISLETFTAERPSEFKYWSDVKMASIENSVTVPVRFNAALTLDVTFQYDGSFTLYAATAPGQPPAKNSVFYIETSPVRSASFTTQLSPHQKTEHAPKSSAPKINKEPEGLWQRFLDWF